MGLYIILYLVLAIISIGMLLFTANYIDYLFHKRHITKTLPQSESLIAALKDTDSRVRAAAALSIGALNYENGIEPLIEILNDNDRDVRLNAVRALAQLSEKRALEPLIEKLKDESSDVRAEAAQALGLIKDWTGRVQLIAVPALITVLKDEAKTVRAAAVYALEQFKDGRALEPLIDSLKDADPAVRVGAIKALSQINDLQAVEPLITVLKDADPAVRADAALVLGIFGDQRAAEPLRAIINDNDRDVGLCSALALAMIKQDHQAAENLSAALALTKHAKVDQKAASEGKKAQNLPRQKYEGKRSPLPIILGWLLIVGSFFQLTSSLRDYNVRFIPEQILNLENPAWRESAIKTLSNAGPRAIQPLMDAFHGTNNEYLRSGIVETLSQISWHSEELMIALLKDDAPAIRAAAAEALGRSGDKRAVEPLLNMLKDKDPSVRAWAAWSLGFIADERAVEPLIIALNDVDATVRLKGAGGLVNIGNERADGPLMTLVARRELAIIAEESAYFVKHGKAGDEPVFIEALFAFGTKKTANDYLNCGNIDLEKAAREWAKLNGYEIGTTSLQGDDITWGGN